MRRAPSGEWGGMVTVVKSPGREQTMFKFRAPLPPIADSGIPYSNIVCSMPNDFTAVTPPSHSPDGALRMLRIGYSKDGPKRKCEEQNDFHWLGER